MTSDATTSKPDRAGQARRVDLKTSRSERPLAEGGVSDEVAWAVVDAAPDGIVVVDAEGSMILVNSQLEAMFGYDRGELLGRTIEHLLEDSLARLHRTHRDDYRNNPSTRSMGDGEPLQARRRDCSTFPVEISLSPVEGPDGLCTIAAVRDITERLAMEAAARVARDRDRLLHDRERMARELHDNVIQELFVAGLGLQSLASQMSGDKHGTEVLEIVGQLDAVIRSIRTSIFSEDGSFSPDLDLAD